MQQPLRKILCSKSMYNLNKLINISFNPFLLRSQKQSGTQNNSSSKQDQNEPTNERKSKSNNIQKEFGTSETNAHCNNKRNCNFNCNRNIAARSRSRSILNLSCNCSDSGVAVAAAAATSQNRLLLLWCARFQILFVQP